MIRRLVYGLVTLLALSAVVFTLLQLGGGSPIDRLRLNPRIQPETIQQLTQRYGLDQPGYVQYFTWLRKFVWPKEIAVSGIAPWVAVAGAVLASYFIGFRLHVREGLPRIAKWIGMATIWAVAIWVFWGGFTVILDWGDSFRGDGPVFQDVTLAAGATFRLGLAALTLALIVGVPLGIYQATRQYSFFDQVGTTFSFVAFSTPIFIIGLGLQLLLGLYLERWTGVKVFFTAGMTSPNYSDLNFLQQMGDVVRHLALPAVSIAAISLAGYSRFQRASMLEVLHSDYLRTAKAKGLPRRKVILKHALRNAMIPIVTLVSLDVAFVIGGAIITESIFGWPGVGRLYIDAINAVDYPAVMAVVMAIGIAVVVMNIVADILYGVLDPRVRYD